MLATKLLFLLPCAALANALYVEWYEAENCQGEVKDEDVDIILAVGQKYDFNFTPEERIKSIRVTAYHPELLSIWGKADDPACNAVNSFQFNNQVSTFYDGCVSVPAHPNVPNCDFTTVQMERH